MINENITILCEERIFGCSNLSIIILLSLLCFLGMYVFGLFFPLCHKKRYKHPMIIAVISAILFFVICICIEFDVPYLTTDTGRKIYTCEVNGDINIMELSQNYKIKYAEKNIMILEDK